MKNQKSTDKFWMDETGAQIPYSRTNESERFNEKASAAIAKTAMSLNADLIAFKEKLNATCKKAYELYMEEKGSDKKSKGNFNWFNFDRSIKIEVSVNDRIEFDDLGIIACKNKLDEFLGGNVESKDDAVKALIMDAFNNTKGKLDAKKVMNLLRYRSKIKNHLFQDALNLLESAIRKPDSKTYFRIWVKDETGQYKNIDLNLSSIC